jgi:thioredoxin 1
MTAIQELTWQNFEQSILHGVTLVDFDAPWCKPCQDQKPIIEALKKSYRGKAAVQSINIDDHRDIANNLGIQSIPTIIIYKSGKEMNRFIGLQTTKTLAVALEDVIDQAN